jgi:hypothetical protein
LRQRLDGFPATAALERDQRTGKRGSKVDGHHAAEYNAFLLSIFRSPWHLPCSKRAQQ